MALTKNPKLYYFFLAQSWSLKLLVNTGTIWILDMKAKLGGAAGRIRFCWLVWIFFSLWLKNKCKRFITSAKKTLLSSYDGQFEQQEEIYFGIDFLPTRRLKIAKKCFFGGDVALSEYDSQLIIFLSVEVNVLDILSKKNW